MTESEIDRDDYIRDHLVFLMAGGTLHHHYWEVMSEEEKQMMIDAGRRFIAFKSATNSLAITNISAVWSIFDDGQSLEEAFVKGAAAAAANSLQAMIDKESS